MVDAGHDTIESTAPGGASVEAYAYSPAGSGSPTKITTAAGDGSWRVDFSGVFDVQPGGTANAVVRDSDGDATTVSKQPALLYARLTNDWFNVTGFGSDSALAYTLRSAPGGSVLANGTVMTDDWGSAFVYGVGDLVPGQQLTVTDGAVTKDLTFTDVKITSVDAAADAVTGTAPAGSDLEVSVYRSPSSYTLHATAGADGKWLADFTGSFDLDGGTSVTAVVRDGDGDATSVDRQPAVLQVSLTWGDAFVTGMTPNASVTFTLRDTPGGAVLASGSQTASSYGTASWYPPGSFAPGMELSVDDGSSRKALTISALTITAIDARGASVSGTASPGAHVSVYVRNSSLASPTREVVADATGNWSADFAGLFDLHGVTALASIFDGDGDYTSVQRQAASIDASLMDGAISAYGLAPWANSTLTIRGTAGGTVLATRTAKSDGYGYLWFGQYRDHGVELAPGNELTVTDGTTTKHLTLADVSVRSADVAADVVTGRAPAGAGVDVLVANGSTSLTATATADGAGRWRADFHGRYDISWSTDATASVHDEDGDVTEARKLPTRLFALVAQDELFLSGFVSHSAVTVTLRTSPTGAILYSGEVSADSYGSAVVERVTHGVDLTAGTYVAATDGENMKDLTLAAIKITGVDAIADVVRGTAPAGARVDVYVASASMHVTTGSDATWLADFTGAYDIRGGSTARAETDDAELDTTATMWAPWLDTTPPTIAAPAGVGVDASSTTGGIARFSVTASDDVDSAPTLSCSFESGTWFAIGDTTVDCTATDAVGNQAATSFVVHVRGAAEQLVRLRTAVVHVGPGTSLADRVTAATNALAAGNRVLARSILNAFANQVRAQSGKSIAPATAATLLADAQRIRNVIGS